MSWKNSEIYKRTRGKSWWTRVTGFWNNLLNSDHDWIDYENARESIWSDGSAFKNTLNSIGSTLSSAFSTLNDPSQITSYVNSLTGAHLTGSQIEANDMAMQNQEDIYQRQVAGMQKAGLNPALMYDNGTSSAPSPVQGQTGTASMSDIMQALLLDKQSKLLESQTRNTDADTDKKTAETENMKLINHYYPEVTRTTIDKMLKDMGLTDAQIEETFASINSKNLDTELKQIEKVIKKAQADEASAFYKATRELEEAKTEKERAEKKELVVRTAMETIEKEYMANTNNKMGSASVVAIASALGTLFSNFSIDFDSEGFKEKFNKKFNDILDWINKPKKAPWVKDE